MPDVFLSYSREDQSTARVFAETLAAEGFDVWWDQTLKAGEAFDEVTERALEAAKAVVVLWSRHSVNSRWVRAEATQAQAGNRLVPVMIEPCKRPIMFELTHTADLAGWQGDAADARWQSLIDGLLEMTRDKRAGDTPAAGVHTSRDSVPDASSRRRYFWTAGVIASLALAASGTWWSLGSGSSAGEFTSLAVMPLDDLSPDKDQGSLADGVADEIFNRLLEADPKRLRVISGRAKRGKSAMDVSRELNVKFVLDGAWVKSGDELRVTVRVLNPRTNEPAWSKVYNFPNVELLVAQDAIASDVASTLQVALRVGISLQPGMTQDLNAWEAYRRAQRQWNLGWPAGWKSAQQSDEEAIGIDPNYAIAWADLGYIYDHIARRAESDNAGWQHKSDAAFEEAARLVPDLPYMHLMKYHNARDRGEIDAALGHWQDLQRAQARQGGYVPDTDIPLDLLAAVGRFKEFAQELELQKQRDRLNLPRPDLVMAYAITRQWTKAYAEAESASQSPRLSAINRRAAAGFGLWAAMGERDRTQILRALAETARLQPPTETRQLAVNQRMTKLLDRPAEALEFLHARALDPATPSGTPMITLAAWMAYHGDAQGALRALRSSSPQPENSQPSIALRSSPQLIAMGRFMWQPVYHDMRGLPEFRQWVTDLGLVDIWRKTGNWGDFCVETTDGQFRCD